MNQRLPAALAAVFVSVALLSAAPKFLSAWRSPEAGAVSFAGKKVAALVISKDESLRVAGEEALVRELTGRGLQSVATYRIAPKEELQSADSAKGWFEKANVEGVVAVRPVSNEKRTTYNPGTWISPAYSTFWGYYGYGWGSTYIPGSVDRDTVVASHGGVCRVLMAHLGILPNDTASTGNVAQGVIYVFTGGDMDIVQ